MIFMTSFRLISVPIKYFIKDITNSKVKETIKAPYRASMSVTLEGGLSRIRVFEYTECLYSLIVFKYVAKVKVVSTHCMAIIPIKVL